MQDKSCLNCGTIMKKPKNVGRAQWLKRKFCSQACNGANHATHGEAWKAPEYAIWQAMIQRCTNPNNKGWSRYGGRGILVCDRWAGSYENFISDIGKRPSPNHSLDRIDNDSGYSPENCRWTDIITQANNTRWNRVLPFNGQSMTVSEWSKHIGIRPNTIVYRLRRGWPVDKTLSTPLDERYAHMRKNT